MSKKPQVNFKESEYTAILDQAISQIKTARTFVAKQVNTTANSVYWNLGKLLF